MTQDGELQNPGAMEQTKQYQPQQFWESAHSRVPTEDVRAGLGVRNVGGGRSSREAAAFYRARKINMGRLLKKVGLPTHPKIFEMGSGGGYWVNFFTAFQPSIFIGSDISSTAILRLGKAFPNYLFYCLENQTSWRSIEEKAPFDLCLAIDVLYHITNDEIWAENLSRLCNLCGAGGYLIIADYFYPQPTEQPSRIHVKFRTMQSYLEVFDRHNFNVEAIQPIFYFLNRIVGGPWKDQNRLTSALLRLLFGNRFGLGMVGRLDTLITGIARPMDPRCKTRFLLARKI
jgi:hypothetical protein